MIIDSKDFDNFMVDAKDFVDINLMNDIGNEALNFFKQSFINQGWTDGKFEPWKPIKDKGGKILIKKGKLWNSMLINKLNDDMVEIISMSDYATIHNEGGVVKITKKMKKFYWSKYKSTKKEFWKALALSDKFTIPKRQFMGESRTLDLKIENIIIEKWEKM